MANTKREDRIEELGRVDAEKAKTKKGKKNLWAEKKRIRKELTAKSGTIVTAKGGTMIKAKKGFGKKLAKAAVLAGAAYAGSKFLKGKGSKLKGTNVLDYEGEAAGLHGGKSGLIDAISGGTKFAKKSQKLPLFSGTMGMSKTGGTVKAKTGKMLKARGGVIVDTKLNGKLFTQTF